MLTAVRGQKALKLSTREGSHTLPGVKFLSKMWIDCLSFIVGIRTQSTQFCLYLDIILADQVMSLFNVLKNCVSRTTVIQ